MSSSQRAELEKAVTALKGLLNRGAHVDTATNLGLDLSVVRSLVDAAQHALDLGGEADIRRALAYLERESDRWRNWIELRDDDGGGKIRH